ncbi:hypothetical protein PENSPDRAFT_689921 [Peniophora sp. CONT]|nr:hypothetical protein PENSPDRAFT_689921 [Peniophora sp. CONT]
MFNSSSTASSRNDSSSTHTHSSSLGGYLSAKSGGRATSLLSLNFFHPSPSSQRTSKQRRRESALSYSTYSSQTPDVAEMLDDDNMSWGKTPRRSRHHH